jgi:DNA-binding CsgD family transcriptional regulator
MEGSLMEQLTPRQREIMRRLARGEAPKEIASALCISIHTVRCQMQRARERTRKPTMVLVVAAGLESH